MNAAPLTFTVEESARTGPGDYLSTFAGCEMIDPTEEGRTGCVAFTFADAADPGTLYKGFATAGTPRVSNKLGRWLCALAGLPDAKAGTPVTPDEFAGRKYVVTYAPSKDERNEGKVVMTGFEPVPEPTAATAATAGAGPTATNPAA